MFVSHMQGRPTGTGRCCTASSVGREATRTTSCGQNASAPLPVHAGETLFHWLKSRSRWCAVRPSDISFWNAAVCVFLGVLLSLQQCWQDVVCGLCRKKTQVLKTDMSVNQSSRTRKYHHISHCPPLSLPPFLFLSGLTFVWRSVCGLWAQAVGPRGPALPWTGPSPFLGNLCYCDW